MQNQATPESPNPPRPAIVGWLAILTLVGNILYLAYEGISAAVPGLDFNLVELPTWVNVVNYVAALAKLVLVLPLLRMRKVGFYGYVVAELATASMAIVNMRIALEYTDSTTTNPLINFDPALLPIITLCFSLGLSVAFIGGFATQLSKMR